MTLKSKRLKRGEIREWVEDNLHPQLIADMEESPKGYEEELDELVETIIKMLGHDWLV